MLLVRSVNFLDLIGFVNRVEFWANQKLDMYIPFTTTIDMLYLILLTISKILSGRNRRRKKNPTPTYFDSNMIHSLGHHMHYTLLMPPSLGPLPWPNRTIFFQIDTFSLVVQNNRFPQTKMNYKHDMSMYSTCFL